MPASPYLTPCANQTVAQVLLRYLRLEGVDKVFGIPGGGLTNLLVEFKNQRNSIDYVICRHETGAAYIADGYYRATGKLGVVMVTSGPGATNALTGAMNAQNDGSALLVITGEVNEQYFGKGYLQEGLDADLDINAIYKAASCYSAELTDQSEVQTLVEQALRDVLTIPRGMAHITITSCTSATSSCDSHTSRIQARCPTISTGPRRSTCRTTTRAVCSAGRLPNCCRTSTPLPAPRFMRICKRPWSTEPRFTSTASGTCWRGRCRPKAMRLREASWATTASARTPTPSI